MITLIWQVQTETAWEIDWIEHLFRNIPHRTIADYGQSAYIDKSLIIYNHSIDNTQYIKDLRQKGLKFGLVHLSDEWGTASTENYHLADVVLRNYYKDLGPNVINFALGCMRTFPYNRQPNTIYNRPDVWSFSGHVDKSTRPEMAKHMATVPGGKYYFKMCGQNWGPFEGHALNPVELFDFYNSSIFVPCPAGNCSIDSLRVCEALQAGALPIVESNDYWSNLYGKDHPLIEIDSWDEVPGLIANLMSDPMLLEQKRLETYKWWITYCDNLSNQLQEIL